MIYIPDKNINEGKEETLKNNANGLKWKKIIHWNYNDEFVITMACYDNPLFNEVLCLNGKPVMECSCHCLPQLRFNQEWKKWICCCPSVFVKNTNEDEIDKLKTGWQDNPIKAIVKWNMEIAENILKWNMEILKNN